MKSSFRIIFVPLLMALALPGGLSASVIFKPNEGVHYKAPGEEEMSGTVQQLFERAQQAERQNNPKGAIKIYRLIYTKHSHDALAAGAVYRMAQLQEQTNNPLGAAQSYAVLVEK
ncbi:MAG: tetratricopeptide repeat protein, partial [Chthoniobacterales bacterium]